MRLFKQMAKNNINYRQAVKFTPKGVLWHSTGANNPNLKRYVGPDDGKLGINKYKNYWNRKTKLSCCHAFIGLLNDKTIATYQILPWNYRAWHCGKSKKGSANSTHIGFEICEDDLKNKDYAMKVYREAVELTAYLCKLYKLDPFGKLPSGLPVITDHAEAHKYGYASNHGDVLHWFSKYGISLDKVRQDVSTEMKKSGAGSSAGSKAKKVQVTAKAGLKVRAGAGTNYKQIGFLKYGTIVEISARKSGKGAGEWGYVPDQGWISLDWVKPVSVPVSTPAQAAQPKKVQVTSKLRLRVRSGPGTNYKQVGSLKSKAIVEITGTKPGKGAKLWGYVPAKKGWISLDYTRDVR